MGIAPFRLGSITLPFSTHSPGNFFSKQIEEALYLRIGVFDLPHLNYAFLDSDMVRPNIAVLSMFTLFIEDMDRISMYGLLFAFLSPNPLLFVRSVA